MRAAGASIVADEVQYGLGRSGSHFWGFERRGLEPDIVTLGKPVANGYPMGVVIANRALIEAFQAKFGFFSTFGGNAVAAAAGLAVLEVLEREQLMANALRPAPICASGSRRWPPGTNAWASVRGAGLLLGLEVTRDARLTPRQCAKRIINRLASESRVLIGYEGPHADILKLRPPHAVSARARGPPGRSDRSAERSSRRAAVDSAAPTRLSVPQVPTRRSSSGTIWNRSPTRPTSATSKIGASLSLLMATMVRASLMPVRCWIAPEMPMAMYISGEMILPVWPDLHFIGRIAGIDGGARGADGRADLVGEAEQQLEVLGAAERAAARYDLRRRLQVRAIGRPGSARRRSGCARAGRRSGVLESIDARAAASPRPRRRRRARWRRACGRDRLPPSRWRCRHRSGGESDRRLSTAIKSLTCGTPSSAATRGMRSLPKLVEGPNTWL